MIVRPRRVVIGAAALVAVLVTLLIVANWGTVRDHVEAWHCQLTRETHAIDPEPTPSLDCARVKGHASGDMRSSFPLQAVLGVLTCSGLSVIHDLWVMEPDPLFSPWVTWPPADAYEFRMGSSWSVVRTVTPELATQILRANGYRVLEQRFPRRAYVIIRADDHPFVDIYVRAAQPAQRTE